MRSFANSVAGFAILGASLGMPGLAQACPFRATQGGHIVSYQVVETRPAAATSVILTATTEREVRVSRAEAVELPEVMPGAVVSLFANFLGKEPGYVLLEVNGTSIQAEIQRWESNRVQVKLPPIGLRGSVEAKISVLLPNGQIAHAMPIRLKNFVGIRVDHDGLPDAKENSTAPAIPRAEPRTSELMIPSSMRLQTLTLD